MCAPLNAVGELSSVAHPLHCEFSCILRPSVATSYFSLFTFHQSYIFPTSSFCLLYHSSVNSCLFTRPFSHCPSVITLFFCYYIILLLLNHPSVVISCFYYSFLFHMSCLSHFMPFLPFVSYHYSPHPMSAANAMPAAARPTTPPHP